MEWYFELLICIPTCCCFCLLVDHLRDKHRARAKRASFKAIVEQIDKEMLEQEIKDKTEKLPSGNDFDKNLP